MKKLLLLLILPLFIFSCSDDEDSIENTTWRFELENEDYKLLEFKPKNICYELTVLNGDESVSSWYYDYQHESKYVVISSPYQIYLHGNIKGDTLNLWFENTLKYSFVRVK